MNAKNSRMAIVGFTAVMLGALGCSAGAESSPPQSDDAQARDELGTVSQELARGAAPGGGTAGSSCGAPPMQCKGTRYQSRAIYPGCSVDCGPGQTAMCMAGDCFFGRAPSCTCQTLVVR